MLGGVSGVAAVVDCVKASVTSGGSSNVGANASDVGGDGAEAEELETGDWRRIDGCSILRSTSPDRHPDGCHRTTFEMAWEGAAN